MAADLQHVVAAAGVGVGAVRIAHVLVAALGPLALEGVARLLAVAPVHQRGARATDVEVADLAVGDRPAVVAAQLDLVARHRLAGACRSARRRAGSRGRCAASRWSRCRRRCSQPKCALKRSPSSRGSASPADEHMRSATSLRSAATPATPACRRSRSARRRTASASGRAAPVQRLNTASGVGRSAISTTIAPAAQRKGQRIAEAVGEEELGRREADVALA